MGRIETAKSINSNEPKQYIGGLEIVKVIREHIPIEANGTLTMGELIDLQLQEAALRYQEIQDITLHIEKDWWTNFTQMVHSNDKTDY